MRRNHQAVSDNGAVVLLLVILNAIVLERGFVSHPDWYWALLITLPLLIVSILSGWRYRPTALRRRSGITGKTPSAGFAKQLMLNKLFRLQKRRKRGSFIQNF